MPCFKEEIITFNLELYESISLGFAMTQLNLISNIENNTNIAQIGENNVFEENSNYFQLYDDFEKDMDDESAKNNDDLNPWRKDYFDFLENKNNKLEINEMFTIIE